MKILNKLTIFILTLFFAIACNKDEDKKYSFDYIGAPANVSAIFNITNDNTGLVTILPSAEGAQTFLITFGDVEEETPVEYNQGDLVSHIYTEGIYNVTIVAVGATGLIAELVEEITVSFTPPENLQITVENDLVVSKQVNISATADYATVINVFFGETVGEDPIETLPGETVSHVYQNAGDYNIKVVAKSGSIETLDSTFTFTVTEITGPIVAAPTPPGRVDSDVISIFSDAYTNLEGTDFNPNWGQSTIVSTKEIVAGDTIMKYANLNYQGTQFANPIDASNMTYLHVDMWTDDATDINIFTISSGPEEKAYNLPITSGEWVSYEIPLTDFSNVVDLSDIIQFKIDGTEGSSIYLDNIYFYRDGASTELVLPIDFESSVVAYEFTDFDGGAATIIDNPQSVGINTSLKVAQMVKSVGQTWGGSFLTLDNPIDFTAGKTFTMKVFSPKVGAKVLLKVENISDGNINFETEVATTVANEWEELSFDYSAIDDSQTYQKIVLIFELGTMGDGTADFTYLFDDIALTN